VNDLGDFNVLIYKIAPFLPRASQSRDPILDDMVHIMSDEDDRATITAHSSNHLKHLPAFLHAQRSRWLVEND